MKDPKNPSSDPANQTVSAEIAERIELNRRLQQARNEALSSMAQSLRPNGFGTAQFGNAGGRAVYPYGGMPYDPFNNPYHKSISVGASTLPHTPSKIEAHLQELENRVDDLERFHAWMMVVYPEKYAEFKQVQDAIKASREGE